MSSSTTLLLLLAAAENFELTADGPRTFHDLTAIVPDRKTVDLFADAGSPVVHLNGQTRLDITGLFDHANVGAFLRRSEDPQGNVYWLLTEAGDERLTQLRNGDEAAVADERPEPAAPSVWWRRFRRPVLR